MGGQKYRRARRVQRTERHADQPHVVMERQPLDRRVGVGRLQTVRTVDRVDVRAQIAVCQRHALGSDVAPDVNCTNARSSSDGSRTLPALPAYLPILPYLPRFARHHHLESDRSHALARIRRRTTRREQSAAREMPEHSRGQLEIRIEIARRAGGCSDAG